MAVKEDYENLALAARRWGASHQQGIPVTVLSPDQTQMKKLEENLPKSVFFTLRERDWDLNKPYPEGLHKVRGIIVACNVFHYSPDPELWFKNVFTACKEFWLQDLVHRPRGDRRQLGSDGDKQRYFLGNSEANYGHFDLSRYRGRLLDYWVYDAGSERDGKTLINFMARFRGDFR